MTLYVSEYPGLAGTAANEGAVPILPVPPTTQYAIQTSGINSASLQPFLPTTAFIELCTDTTCSVLILPFSVLAPLTYTLTTQVGRLNANERVIRRVPSSPQFGGASSIPQTATTYGIVTSASS